MYITLVLTGWQFCAAWSEFPGSQKETEVAARDDDEGDDEEANDEG